MDEAGSKLGRSASGPAKVAEEEEGGEDEEAGEAERKSDGGMSEELGKVEKPV